MTADDPPILGQPPVSQGDETEDARYVADFIAALKAHAESTGHPEMASVLSRALGAAQATAGDASGRKARD